MAAAMAWTLPADATYSHDGTQIAVDLQPRIEESALPASIVHAWHRCMRQGDYGTAFRLMQRMALVGHPDAQNNLGVLYFRGLGIPKDVDAALVWWHRAADSNSAAAQQNLGNAYMDGIHGEPDVASGLRWLRAAAAQGEPTALHRLGHYYREGRVVQRNLEETKVLWEAAASRGYAPAQSDLGSLYMEGLGIAKNPRVALEWYEKSARQGYAPGQFNAGVALWKAAQPGSSEQRQAVRYWQAAAEQGLAAAQYSLGECYMYGWGLPQDVVSAYVWMRLAALQNLASARTEQSRLEPLLSVQQRTQADRRLENWRRASARIAVEGAPALRDVSD